MSLAAIFCILFFVLLLASYVAYFILLKKGNARAKLLIYLFFPLALGLQISLVLEGRSLFLTEAPVQANWLGILAGIFLSTIFYWPFAKRQGKKFASADLALFLLSGMALLADSISIAYALLVYSPAA